MTEFKHLVLVKFKEGVQVDELLKGIQTLASEVDTVKSFEWGEDSQSPEMLTQGYTHAFLMTFKSKEDFTSYTSHPKHIEFSEIFTAALDKIVLLDFPVVLAKPHV